MNENNKMKCWKKK
ncbi:Protein of unknown function [Bacillus cytotoxicus]|nr:Protein of unknown function [Bacillus cytotoxicus]